MKPLTQRHRPARPPRPAGAAPASGADDPRVIEVLEEYLAAVEAGRTPNRAELLGRYPEVADELTRCLDGLEFVQAAVPHLESASGPAARLPEPAELPRTALGDYRLVREVGRGGMGIVYEAEQLSLGRRVALKVLPFAAALDPRQLQRFKSEAQAAAQLHHPHIVPVYAVGCERGVHYFAMQYIDGQSLAEVVRDVRERRGLGSQAPGDATGVWPERPSTLLAAAATTVRSGDSPAYFRSVAGLAIQAAEALDHAHQVGVVHRDVKPANLLVDGRGELWVTDFGLARLPGDAGVTLTGDLVGTLRYMSPEQARGKRGLVDHRSDVYSLGVTLYELLTLRPAFDGETREELLVQITRDEPPTPRRVNRAVPAELETIVLKAMAKDPAERYATAQELADDLRRFLDDQPIRARRPSLGERAFKWARRHRRLVTAAAALTAVAVAGLVAGTVLLWREQERTEARFWLAQQAVEEMYTRVADEWLDRQPYLEQVQADFLRKALAFYEKFARETGRDPRLRLEAAKAHRRMGDIHRKLGAYDEAEAAFDRALPVLEALAAEFPGKPECREQFALACNNRGHLFRDRARFAEAEADYHQAIALYQELVAEAPDRPEYRAGLAGTSNNAAIALQALARPREAEELFRQALALLEVGDDESVARRHDRAGVWNNLAGLLRDTGRPREAEAAYRQALDGWGRLVASFPGVPLYRQGQAAAYHGRAVLLGALERTEDARYDFERALELRRRLAGDFPNVPLYQQELAATHHAVGGLLASAGRMAEAEQAYRDAARLRGELAAAWPGVAAYGQDLAATQERLSEVQKRKEP